MIMSEIEYGYEVRKPTANKKNSRRDVRGHHTPGEIILIVLIWLELYGNLCFV